MTANRKPQDRRSSAVGRSVDGPPALPATIVALHDAACERGEQTYRDPATGFRVFTALAHQRRGSCCGNRCRHCPYDYENVP